MLLLNNFAWLILLQLLLHSYEFQPISVTSTLVSQRRRWTWHQYQHGSTSKHCKNKLRDASQRSRHVITSLKDSSKNDLSDITCTSIKVGIAGAGSIAFGTASLLSSLGHDPMLWSPSGSGTKHLFDSSDHIGPDNIVISKIQSTGAIDQEFDVRIAQTPKELVASNDNVLVIALPVNGHKQVMKALAPEIVQHDMNQRTNRKKANNDPDGDYNPIMHVIISSHASLGAVYLMNLLKEHSRYLSSNNISSGLEELDWIRITSWGTTAVTSRKLSGASVKVLTIRQAVDFCTVPSSPSDDHEGIVPLESVSVEGTMTDLLSNGYNLCTCLFGPRFKHRKGGLLAISLSNLNPQNHLGIVLGNMSRMDPPPPPPPVDPQKDQIPETSIEPWYQGKCITPSVGRLMEALDRERIEIANALDIDVRTIYQHFSWSFHVPMETPITDDSVPVSASGAKTRPLTVSEMNQMMHYYVGTDVLGPSVPDSRYVLEDVPYGLVLTVILGRLLNRQAQLHEAGIMILSAMYGRDFMNENELLQGLGLIGKDHSLPSLDEWKEMAYTGSFDCGVSPKDATEGETSVAEAERPWHLNHPNS